VNCCVPDDVGRDRLVGSYERLRDAVIASVRGDAPGVASVRHQGLWAWVALAQTRPAPAPCSTTQPRPPTPPVGFAQMVPVWANLVLGTVSPMEAR
jgi:hypothetical protein